MLNRTRRILETKISGTAQGKTNGRGLRERGPPQVERMEQLTPGSPGRRNPIRGTDPRTRKIEPRLDRQTGLPSNGFYIRVPQLPHQVRPEGRYHVWPGTADHFVKPGGHGRSPPTTSPRQRLRTSRDGLIKDSCIPPASFRFPVCFSVLSLQKTPQIG